MSEFVLPEPTPVVNSPPHKQSLRKCDVVIEDRVIIPAWVDDLESYRRWARSGGYPNQGWYSFLNGQIWVDLSREELFSHNLVRSACTAVLGSLMHTVVGGYYVNGRMLLSHSGVNLSTEPDGLAVSWKALESGRLRLIEGKNGDYVELEGAPDIVLEILSSTSVRKDTQVLRDLYWRAEIAEYWLVDARSEQPRLDILQHGPEGYVSAPAQDGWLTSRVFGRAFRLVKQTDPLGYPKFRLEVRPTTTAGPQSPEARA